MCWKKVEENCKAVYESEFISVEKPLERKYIISLISEEFPEIPRIRIAATVDRGVKHFQIPINRNAFLRFVQNSL